MKKHNILLRFFRISTEQIPHSKTQRPTFNIFKLSLPKIKHPKLNIHHSSSIIQNFQTEPAKIQNSKFKIQNPLIPSSALGYAIAFLLLIGLVCTGVLFISSVNKRLEHHYSVKEHLVFDNYFALLYGTKMQETGKKELYHPSGDSSLITVKSWGAFKMVVARTWHRNSKQQKSALIGYEAYDALPALYLPDNNQSLKLAGDTKIEGTVYLPERGVDRAYIAGKNYSNDKLIYGEEKKSERYLPKLNSAYINLKLEDLISGTKKVEGIFQDTVFAFDDTTRILSTIDPLYINFSIKGNIILHSFDSIRIASTAHLENVIVIAPKVYIENGFRGSAQIIAHKSITCEENVRLLYPSTLVLNELSAPMDGEANHIVLKEKTQVLGGILMVSQNSNFRKPIYLKLSEETVVSGIVYNQGVSEIRGSVIGHLYSQSFYLKAGGSEQSNHLMDCTISSKRLPKDFMIPNWIASEKKGKQKVICIF